MLNISFRKKVLVAFLALLILIGAFSPPLAELSGYFHFVDQRELLGLPRAMDVLSNLPFLFAGLYGLFVIRRSRTPDASAPFKPFASIFFIGHIVTALGSAWFELRLKHIAAFRHYVGVLQCDKRCHKHSHQQLNG